MWREMVHPSGEQSPYAGGIIMKNILALIGAAVVLFVGLGWYLEWYKLGSEPTPDGHRKINVDVNTKKIIADEQNAVKKVSDVISSETKGTTVVPSIPTPAPEKKVEGQPTGFQYNADGSITIIPPYKNI